MTVVDRIKSCSYKKYRIVSMSYSNGNDVYSITIPIQTASMYFDLLTVVIKDIETGETSITSIRDIFLNRDKSPIVGVFVSKSGDVNLCVIGDRDWEIAKNIAFDYKSKWINYFYVEESFRLMPCDDNWMLEGGASYTSLEKHIDSLHVMSYIYYHLDKVKFSNGLMKVSLPDSDLYYRYTDDLKAIIAKYKLLEVKND